MKAKLTEAETVEVCRAGDWLEVTALGHIQDRGLCTLQCSCEVFGVRVGVEAFYQDGSGVLTLCVVSAVGIWQAEQPFNVGEPGQAEEWAAAVGHAFTVAAPGLLGSGVFCVKRDQLALEAAAVAASSGGARRL